jgi:hypothetical protein
MGEQEGEVRADPADEEARKAHAFVWAAEGLLHRAHELARQAEEKLRDVTGDARDSPRAEQ